TFWLPSCKVQQDPRVPWDRRGPSGTVEQPVESGPSVSPVPAERMEQRVESDPLAPRARAAQLGRQERRVLPEELVQRAESDRKDPSAQPALWDLKDRLE